MSTCHKSELPEYRASSKECPDCLDSCGKAHPNSGLHFRSQPRSKGKVIPPFLAWPPSCCRVNYPVTAVAADEDSLADSRTSIFELSLWTRTRGTQEPSQLPVPDWDCWGTSPFEVKNYGLCFPCVSQFHPLLWKTVTVQLFWLMKQLPSAQSSSVILLLLLF